MSDHEVIRQETLLGVYTGLGIKKLYKSYIQ